MLDPDVAASFLASRAGDPDRRAARDLAVELGGLPLALEQAAAYMTATGETLAGYLALFRHRRAEMLARGEPAGYSKTVASTWTLAFGQLRQAAPRAISLLRLLGFCAPERIPLRLLLRPHTGLPDQLVAELAPLLDDPLAADDAVAALRRYTLVTPAAGWFGVGASAGASRHRWRAARRPSRGVAAGCSAIDRGRNPRRYRVAETWSVCAALLPHAQAALPASSDGIERIADFLGFSGNYGAARVLQLQIVDAREQLLGAEHPRPWPPAATSPPGQGMAGDAAGARDQMAALLPVIERVAGAEHPDTLAARHGLAHWTGYAGDPAGARDQMAALLPVRERVIGAEDLSSLVARGNLAYWTGRAGDAAGARDQMAALQPVIEKVLGPEHPATLANRASLADWTGYAGDPAAARDQLAAVLPLHEQVIGAAHPSTVITRAELAYWTGEAGDAAGARAQYAALLPTRGQASGPEHPDTLAARASHDCWTGRAGDAAGGRDQLAAVLPVLERVLGPEHPGTLAARHELARWTGEADGEPYTT